MRCCRHVHKKTHHMEWVCNYLHDGLGHGDLEAQLLHGFHKALVQLGRPDQPRPLQSARQRVLALVCTEEQNNSAHSTSINTSVTLPDCRVCFVHQR